MLLDKEKLQEIDSKLDASIQLLPFLKYKREVALFHLLSYYEKFVTNDSIKATGNITDHNSAIKNAQDGIDFAVQWIYKYSPNIKSGKNIKLQPKILKQAEQFLIKAMDYSSIWDYMNFIHRDLCVATVDEENTITLVQNKDYKIEYDVINRFLNTVDTEDDINNEIESILNANTISIVEKMDYKIKNNKLEYVIPDSVYIQIAELNYHSKKHLLELPNDWDLGGYLVKDFHHFYNFLRTVTFIHIQGCIFARVSRKDVSNLFLIKSKDEWIELILDKIEIDKSKCETIFNQLVYDFSLYSTGNKSPDVTYQPFIPFTDDKYLLINSLVQQSNYERNHWELLSIIDPNLHSILRNKKEEFWRIIIKDFCKNLNLIVKGPISFTCSKGKSDIDIILIDDVNKIVLLMELKWITSPDRIKDIVYLSKELEKGLSQIELALHYVEEKKDEFARFIDMDNTELLDYQILGLVLSKNSMGNGFTYKRNIPIINEKIFKWVLSEPHNRNIKSLWQVGNELKFMPKKGVHFESMGTEASFGNYKFISKELGMIILKQFDPKVDINFEGIE